MNNDRLFQLECQRAVARYTACVPNGMLFLCDSKNVRSWQVTNASYMAIICKMENDRFRKVFDRYVKDKYPSFLYLCSR